MGLAWEERRKLARQMCNLANDRARLQQAFMMTLEKLGVPDDQINQIIIDVRACDFSSIEKTMKISDK